MPPACIVSAPEPGLISERAYEMAVDLTASLAWHFSTQEAEVSYVVPGRPRTRDLHEFLAWLAVIEPGMVGPETKAESAVFSGDGLRMNLGRTDDYNIVITARSRAALPAGLTNSSYFVHVGEESSSESAAR